MRTVRPQLRVDETERNDSVLLRRRQQALAGAPTSRFGFERHLTEAGERVPHVGRIVNGESTLSLGVDIGERTVGKLRPFRR